MVIDAVERFAKRTADACVTLWDREEIETRSANWPPGYDDLVASLIELKLAETRAS